MLHVLRSAWVVLAFTSTMVISAQGWKRSYGSVSSSELGQVVLEAENGGLFVGGAVADSAFVMRVDSTGLVLWSRSFSVLPGQTQLVMHMEETSDGTIIGSGNAYDAGSPGWFRSGFIFSMDVNGNFHWIRSFSDPSGIMQTKWITEVSTEQLLLFGTVYDMGANSFPDVFTARINGNTGDLITWSEKVNLYGPVPYIDDLVSVSRIGNTFYATGRIFTNGSPQSTCRVHLSRFDTSGTHLGTAYLLYGNAQNVRMYGTGIHASDDSLTISFFGNVSGSSAVYQPGLLRLDTLGNVAWAKLYDVPGHVSEVATSIDVTPNGYVISGYTLDTGSEEPFLIEVDRNGDPLWSRSYGAPGSEIDLLYASGEHVCAVDNAIYLCARTANGGGPEDLFLMRTTADGSIACSPPEDFQVVVQDLPTNTFPHSSFSTPHTIAMQPAASANNVLLPGSCNLQVDLGPDTLSCDTVLLDAGNPGASYLWSDGSTDRTLSVADTGVYWVDVTVDCCTKRDSVWVALDQLPIASFIWAQDPPGSLHAWFQSTSLFADSISWTFSALVLTGDSVSHDFPDMGQYLVCITAYNDCGQDTWCVPVDIFPFTGTDGTGASEVGTLKLFPNPAVDLVFVSHPAIQLTDRILLLDGLGRSVVVPFEITASGRAEIRVQRLAHGSYTVHVLGNDGQRKASGTLIR